MLDVRWITNIPTPYRNHLHERMAEHFARCGMSLMIHFLAWTERGRHWRFAKSDLHYPHRMHRGLHPRFAGHDLHMNPGLLAELARSSPDVLCVGGWSAPTLVFAPYVVGGRPFRFLASESHELSTNSKSGLGRSLRSRIVAYYDGYIVSGDPQRAFLEALHPAAAQRPFVRLANLIDESVYVARVAAERANREAIRRSLQVPPGCQLWVCPARLEPFKGLDRFLPLLRGIEGVQVLVAGDGSLRDALEQQIRRDALPVRLLGVCEQDVMVRLYAAADLFVLPSLRDPCPLSPIEACAAALPLLVSRRIGNLSDVCEEGRNGWTLEPDAPERTAQTLRAIARHDRSALAALGERSAVLFRDRFDTERCVHDLAHGIYDAAVRWRSAR